MDLATRTHRRLLAVVGVLALLTVAGLIALWPSGLPRDPEAPGAVEELVDGTIQQVEFRQGEPDPFTGTSGELAIVDIRVESGPEAGETVTVETPTEGYPDFDSGDEVKLSRSSGADGISYFIVDFERRPALLWLGALFVAAVLLAGGWHGLRSLLGLGVSLLVVVSFIVPAILSGESPELVAAVGAMAVMLVNLYLAHGVNYMTTAAVVGTAAALALTVGLGTFFVDYAALTGFSSEEATLAQFAIEGLDLQGLVLAGLIIAALGVLDDVTVTQSSTVFALHDTDRSLGVRALISRAMRVGRDHIASTVNTLFLAYAGASLALLVLFSTASLPAGEILNTEILAEEIVKTLVGSVGLITAVPLTTALAATIAVRRPADAPAVPTHTHLPAAASSEVPDDALDEEERAHRAWIRFLRDGPRDQVEDPDDEDGSR